MTYHRARGDMIEVYKIIHNIYDQNTTVDLLIMREEKHVSLRGHQFTHAHKRLYNVARVNFFANRVVNIWSSLPADLVQDH